LQDTGAKSSPPSLRALSASHRNPQGQSPHGSSSATRKAQGPTGPSKATRRPKARGSSKAMTSSSPDARPTTRAAHRRTRTRKKRPEKTSRHLRMRQGPATPQGRRPRIPSCLFPTLSNSKRQLKGETRAMDTTLAGHRASARRSVAQPCGRRGTVI
jgi:hypothetical protein